MQSGVADVAVPGEQTPIEVNRYIVARGQNQSVVLYWYQSHARVVASEYKAKFFTVADAISLQPQRHGFGARRGGSGQRQHAESSRYG